MKILLIDDDVMMRSAIARVLIGEGYDVLTAQDGVDGIELFRRAAPDLVITDIFMPRQAGLETIMAIRRENARVKIIAVSGGGRTGTTESLHTAQLLGADELLTKPFRTEELIELILRLTTAPE